MSDTERRIYWRKQIPIPEIFEKTSEQENARGPGANTFKTGIENSSSSPVTSDRKLEGRQEINFRIYFTTNPSRCKLLFTQIERINHTYFCSCRS